MTRRWAYQFLDPIVPRPVRRPARPLCEAIACGGSVRLAGSPLSPPPNPPQGPPGYRTTRSETAVLHGARSVTSERQRSSSSGIAPTPSTPLSRSSRR
jgi:hypothetical protein